MKERMSVNAGISGKISGRFSLTHKEMMAQSRERRWRGWRDGGVGGVVWKRPTRRRTNNKLSWAYLCHGKMQLSFYTLSRELLTRPGGPVETSTAGDARALNSTNTGRRVIAAVYKLPEDRSVWRLVQVYFLYLLMCFCRWLSGVLGESAVERLNTKEEKFSTTWLITLGV